MSKQYLSKQYFRQFVRILILALLIPGLVVGCSHSKTSRGHLFRGDWAFEYNRTPWIGMPPDSGCPEETEGHGCGLFDCLKKDSDKERKGFRRHCGMNAQCTAQNPCCRTLGCGMWVDPADPASLTALGGTAKACGLTPFCSPKKPCRLTPNCGKPVSVNVNPQTLLAGTNAGYAALPNGMMPNGMGGTVRGMSPNSVTADAMGNPVMSNPGSNPGVIPGGIPGSLVSRGIVPGASQITTGGLVAAIGVATPAGTMTPVGVRMNNGMVSNNIVLRACTMTPNCTAAHPCGLTPNCGGAVAVHLISNNAAALASALQAQGTANNTMQSSGMRQAGGMGMLVNPVTNQPINGLTMSGYAQAGYPPIGYAPAGYAPGYPRFAPGNVDSGEQTEEEPAAEEETVMAENRSAMPVPRFHPIPSKPAFQRSEGMMPTPKTQRSLAKPSETAMNETQVSEEELESALDQAYLEGVSAAMNEVERKLELKRQASVKAKLEQKILQQAENVEDGLEEQEQLRLLALQRERKLRQQQAAQMQPMSLVAETIQGPRAFREPAAAPRSVPAVAVPMVTVNMRSPAAAQIQARPQSKPQGIALGKQLAGANPAVLVKNLRSSVVDTMNNVLEPLLGSGQQTPVSAAVRTRTQRSKPSEVAVTPPNLPGRPTVLPTRQNLGLLADDENASAIQQARFADE